MNILFFASLREQLNCSGETWPEMNNVSTTGDLRHHLASRGEPWHSTLSNKKLIVSVNQEVADWETPIKLNDEVAFFPPVTGG